MKLLRLANSWLIIGVVSLLVACTSSPKSYYKRYGATLGDLPPVELPTEPEPVPQVRLANIEQYYRDALEVADDPSIRHRIIIRLADLEMASSEQQQLDATEDVMFFDETIALYKELLVLNSERQGEPGTPTNERLLYKLSKAYALDGHLEKSNEILQRLVEEFPESGYAAEANFRQAELAFNDGKYREAERLYNHVVEAGSATQFYKNSIYMRGWAQFKRGRYLAASRSFIEVLDLTLLTDSDFSKLTLGDKNLATDTLRVLSIALSYQEGAATIAQDFPLLLQRPYLHRIYAGLAELYLDQERYNDSAQTYRAFVKAKPNSDYAPLFSVNAIDVYMKGDFPSFILPAKHEYVANYGVYSDYWRQREPDQRQQLTPYLKEYLVELSSFYHSEGQLLKSAKANGKKQRRNKVKAEENYLKAAKLYGEYVYTFPEDTKNPEMIFLQGEAYYEAGLLADAVKSYERVAYDFVDTKYGADAGYAAIISLSEIIASLTPEDDQKPLAVAKIALTQAPVNNEQAAVVEASGDQTHDGVSDNNEALEQQTTAANSVASSAVKPAKAAPIKHPTTQGEQWREHKIQSSLNFADYYALDKRAVPVLTVAAEELYQRQELVRAIVIAKRLTEWQPPASPALQKTAWLVLSHSHYELAEYHQAEAGYIYLLSILAENDKDRPRVVERIAASIYRQAEVMVAEDDKAAAVDRLLSISAVAPGSEISINGHYDAANYLMDLKEWARAEQVLIDFKRLYPNHALTKTLTPKFAYIYQESQQWGKAAAQLAIMANSGSPDEKRQALYLSAELYEKSGDKSKALQQYRSYANNYPEPFDSATEARFHLVELYGEIKDDQKRDFWLRKLIVEHRKAGSKGTARSTYLAAFAEIKFADDQYKIFERIKLKQPIKKSLKKKKGALNKTLDAYKAVIAYGVAEFATQSNLRVGMIYAQLSKDIMSSERPKGLDELALEEYEILLEDQAYPFEEKAIDIHTKNAQRAWEGIYDSWVKQSFEALAKLLPARFGKKEDLPEVSDALL